MYKTVFTAIFFSFLQNPLRRFENKYYKNVRFVCGGTSFLLTHCNTRKLL